MTQSENFPLIAKTMAELEDVLAEELINLGATDVETGNRMVSFTGDKAMMYKANVHCRTALRILKPIYEFKAETADEVYEAIKELDWDQYLSLDKTFSIDAVVFSHIFSHSKFVAYRVKDAIVDWFNERYNKRPSVSITNPDLVFNIHVSHKTCTLSLDSSGESLHKRGYRVAQTDAPLNEVLAAGMILKSGWRGEGTFIDPMCGSGTLLIEAAMIALGIPPGIHRENFGFEKWNDFDADLFSEIYNDDSRSKEFDYRIIGSDISAKAISISEKNIKSAGLGKYIDLSVKPFQQYVEAPQPAGVLMMNPPYGERIKTEDLDELYGMIGERLKHVFTGYDAYVLSYKGELFNQIGLKPTRRFFLYNGALECEMRHYEIFEGKHSDFDRSERSDDAFQREKRSERLSSAERNSREGYRRSRREAEAAESDGERDSFQRREHRFDDRRERPERTPGDRVERVFDRHERTPDRDRKPREFQKRDSDRDRKPREFGRREFDGDRKFEPRSGGFNKDRKFEPRSGGFDRDRKFEPRSGGFDRDRKFEPRSGGFDRDRRFEPRSDGFNKDRKFEPRSGGSEHKDRRSDFRKDNERTGRDFDRKRNISEKRNFDKSPEFGRKRIIKRRGHQGGSSEQND